MIVAAMSDLIENALMPDGRFYYKELPSLRRRSAGPLVLEALAHAYEISGDTKLIRAGMPTFDRLVDRGAERPGFVGPKFKAGDAVVWPNGVGPKAFGTNVPPTLFFYRAATDAGMLVR